MCVVCREMRSIEERVASLAPEHGAVAQSGRAPAWHAGGSWVQIPSAPLSGWSTTLRHVGFQLGGLVAAEGSFTTGRQGVYRDGSERVRFVFQVRMATRDRPLLEALRSFLGFGSVSDAPARRTTWQPTSTFTINSRRAHHTATIPFAETYLLASNKREQFEAWRDAFLAHEVAHPSNYGKGRSPCSIDGCTLPVRGRGLCRRHYDRATGW